MSFLRGLLAARSHLAMLFGLAGALCIAWLVNRSVAASVASAAANDARSERGASAALDLEKAVAIADGAAPRPRPSGAPLTQQELDWARIAWRYFENNYQEQTGLVNSADKYPSATLWDLGSYLMGMISARELGLIDTGVFDARLTKLVESLHALPLVDGVAPNKAYNTQSLRSVDYNNNEAPNGIGWSALDIARIGVPITIIVWRYPEHTARLRALLAHWRLEQIVKQGQLIGAERTASGELERVQEGRFGYEQYGAKSLFLLGQNVHQALSWEANAAVTAVSGQPIAYDRRLPEKHGGTHNAVVSEPFILDAIEFGWNDETLALSRALFVAQRNRYRDSKVMTAVSEDNLDRAPYFIYGSLLNDMKPWATFTPDGKDASAHRTVSLKAAVGWAYLFDDDYARSLLAHVEDAAQVDQGWYSGKYEANGAINKALTANTNGIVLEILLYRARGPILSALMRSPAQAAPTR